MIQINENYSIDADLNNWILCESLPGKDGKPKVRQSYHHTLEQTLQTIITRSGKDAGGLEQAIRKIERCRNQICEAVQAVDLEKLRRAA